MLLSGSGRIRDKNNLVNKDCNFVIGTPSNNIDF